MKKKILLLMAVATLGFTAATMAQVPNYVPTNGLVGWWPFNGNANDQSGNGNNGTVNGATLTTDRLGNPNCAMQFFSSQYIEVPNLYQTNLNGYTISAWFKRPSSSNGNDGAIVSGSSPGQLPAGLRFNIGSINRLQWGIESNTVNGVLQNAPGDNANYNDNNWHFCVATFSSPNGLVAGTAFKIYVDGSLATTITYHTNWPTWDTTVYAPVNNGTRNTIIGNCGGSANFNNVFKGTLDDIGIWNRALTQQEITALYNGNICYQTITVTDTLLINMGITGFNPVTFNNTIKIFPNPTNDHITIDYGNFSSLNGYQLKITNSLGQQMFQTPINQQSNYVSLASWGGNGLYFVYIIDPQGNTLDIRKIVLQ
jgi:hypothetical protein